MEKIYEKYLLEIDEISNISYCDTHKRSDAVETYEFLYRSEYYWVEFLISFPGTLPEFFAQNPRPIPHVAKHGVVCIERVDQINYDINDIKNVIEVAFRSFFHIVSNNQTSQQDYHLEFGDYVKYYQRHNDSIESYLFDGIDFANVQLIDKYYTPKSIYYALNKDKLLSFVNLSMSHLTYSTAILLPLSKPFIIREMNSKLWLSDIMKCVSDNILTDLVKILQQQKSNNFVLSVPVANNQILLFGIKFAEKLESIERDCEIVEIFQITNLDTKYLKKRGSAIHNESKILLIGVGSLGSEILYHLCKTGFQKIDICDYDIFEANNVYRHFLGFNYCNILSNNNIVRYSKTELMKHEMLLRYPTIVINTFNAKVEELIAKKTIDFSEYDYIINSTGSMVCNKILEHHLFINKTKAKVLYSWLEPYGVAMHIFVCNTTKLGCLHCLEKSTNNVNLSQVGDYIVHNDNCTGSYSRFGSIAISKLATEVVSTIIKNDFSTNRHIVLLGDFDDFLKDGFKLTQYAALSEIKINQLGRDIIYEGCRICGGLVDS